MAPASLQPSHPWPKLLSDSSIEQKIKLPLNWPHKQKQQLPIVFSCLALLKSTEVIIVWENADSPINSTAGGISKTPSMDEHP